MAYRGCHAACAALLCVTHYVSHTITGCAAPLPDDGTEDVTEETESNDKNYHTARMRTEIRRGGLAMVVLAALNTEQYGYSLRKRLLDVGIDIEEGTLYPLIRRLESYGLLQSEWRESEGRKRRYYKASEDGLWALNQLQGELSQMVRSLQQLVDGVA